MSEPAEHISLVPDLVSGIMWLMLFAALTAMFGSKLRRLPFTIALVLMGILLSRGAELIPFLGVLSEFQLTPELVLFVFIPTLIYESAHGLDANELQRNIVPVLILAVPGLLLSTAIIGGIFYYLTSFNLIVSLLLGAILSATDPVAVIAIFKQLGVPERLTVLVEGESLFNDATSLVLAGLLLAIAVTSELSWGTVLYGGGNFLLVFFGGIVVGWIFAMAVCQLLGMVESNPPVEITLTTILAYLSFIIAEHSFHVSGIMAVVAAGLTVGSYGHSKISPSTVEYIHNFWEYAAWLANALIFLMVGMHVDLLALVDSAGLIAVVVVAMLLSRAIVVFGLVPLIGRLPKIETVSRSYQAVMYWGGLRGAIALAIVLSLPESPYRDSLIAVVTGAVLFTLLVQGLTIEPLVKYLKLDEPDLADQIAQREGELQAKQSSLAQIERLVAGGFFSERIARRINEEMRADVEVRERQIADWCKGLDSKEELRVLSMRVLVREKSRFNELFRQGLIDEQAYRVLSSHVNHQLDSAKHYCQLPEEELQLSIGRRVLRRILMGLSAIRLLPRWVERQQQRQILYDYEIVWARFRSASSVLNNMDEIARDSGIKGEAAEIIRALYIDFKAARKDELEEFASLYPEFVEAIQERLGHRLLLISEQEEIQRTARMGILPKGVSDEILKVQSRRLRELKKGDLAHFLDIEPSELLTKVPMFTGLDSAQFEAIAAHLSERSFPKGERIIRQGGKGDSLFMIARGIASVFDEVNGEQKLLTHLFAGDFFGEVALLWETPRNATVSARTPCTLYELHRDDWAKICVSHPGILSSVQLVAKQRLRNTK